ncbi:MAG: carboxypeptidase regulatory-like domain-containing protein [Euryarchaeota archaeon]|nr:carboxypeptidase regulatory-like domain-containing protein [Euryarchaeota archaeon]
MWTKATNGTVGRVLRTSAATVLLLVVLSGNATACFQAGGQSKYTYDEQGSKKLILFLEAKSATADPFLSTDKAAGAVDAYTPPETGPATGPTSHTSRLGIAQPAIEFVLPEPLAQDYFLNLTRYIYVETFWVSQSNRPGTVLVELWLEDPDGKETFVGGDSKGSGSTSTFNPLWMIFRPEVRKFDAGQTLVLRITRSEGTTEFGMGTGGARQSYIEIGYYDTDPLLNPLYLNPFEKHKFAPPTGSEAGDAAEGAAPAALLLSPLLLLGAVVGRRRKPWILASLVLAMGFAGCVSGRTATTAPAAETTGPPPSGTVAVEVERNETLASTGSGTLRGTVTDNQTGLALRGAHIGFLGTSLFTETSKAGAFEFANITAAEYLVRIDLKGYRSIEMPIKVGVGEVITLDVRLDPAIVKETDLRSHLHDDWGDATEKLLYDGVAFEGRIPNGNLVLPGSVRIEIIVDWAPAAGGPYGLELKLGGASTTNVCLSHRAPKVPYNWAFFPNEADSGHAKMSGWTFDFGAVAARNVKIRIWKGVVPFEPAHRDFCGNATYLPQLINDEPQTKTTTQSPPHDHPNSITMWDDSDKFFVPPETVQLRGNLRWTNSLLDGAASAQTQWKLLYKPANVPPGAFNDPQRTAGHKRPTVWTANGTNNYNFVIDVLPEEVDQFYQSRTYWWFALDDGNAPLTPPDQSLRPMSANTNAGTLWYLTVWAHRVAPAAPS